MFDDLVSVCPLCVFGDVVSLSSHWLCLMIWSLSVHCICLLICSLSVHCVCLVMWSLSRHCLGMVSVSALCILHFCGAVSVHCVCLAMWSLSLHFWCLVFGLCLSFVCVWRFGLSLRCVFWEMWFLPLCCDHLVGPVVKASASRAADPGFDSRFSVDIFPGRVIPIVLVWPYVPLGTSTT